MASTEADASVLQSLDCTAVDDTIRARLAEAHAQLRNEMKDEFRQVVVEIRAVGELLGPGTKEVVVGPTMVAPKLAVAARAEHEHEWTTRHVRSFKATSEVAVATRVQNDPAHWGLGATAAFFRDLTNTSTKDTLGGALKSQVLSPVQESRVTENSLTRASPSTDVAVVSERGAERAIDATPYEPALAGLISRSDSRCFARSTSDFVAQPEEVSHSCQAVTNLLRSTWFVYGIGGLIFLNALLIGAETDYMVAHDVKIVPIGFRILNWLFCVVFCVEVSLRLFAQRRNFFRDYGWEWNVFELVTIVLQVLEEVIKTASNASSGLGFSVARVARMLRLMRVIRTVRIFRLVSELRTLTRSILSSLKSLWWAFVCIMFLIYVASIPVAQAVVDHRIQKGVGGKSYEFLAGYFDSLPHTMLRLFACITSGLDWGRIFFALEDTSPFAAFILVMYITVCALAVLNIITGVFVERVTRISKTDKDFLIINTVRELFRGCEGAANQMITLSSFMELLHRPEMLAYFEVIDVHPSEARGLFQLLDLDNSGAIDAEEFLNGCFQLRGPAKALDLALVVQEVRQIHAMMNQTIATSSTGQPKVRERRSSCFEASSDKEKPKKHSKRKHEASAKLLGKCTADLDSGGSIGGDFHGPPAPQRLSSGA
eukprot:CAMPEP_0117513828 /NCGR_PEP_ID=MMETSP0784-20121206/29756_1 /TAXON_ID=39447 /ORGANISM="" /LENGTH=655 /DNA_ID=CAMNT_0005309607 /DNA_START=1 /DNA_END=1968 /DNA_ORIENTATION=-